MSDLSIVLLAALIAGLAASMIRLPPLVGFLAAGFVLNAAGMHELEGLDTIADLGVAILLFGIGLKLDARILARREVWFTGPGPPRPGVCSDLGLFVGDRCLRGRFDGRSRLANAAGHRFRLVLLQHRSGGEDPGGPELDAVQRRTHCRGDPDHSGSDRRSIPHLREGRAT